MSTSYFTRHSISEAETCWDIGKKAERPFIIRAPIRETSLGDLVSKLIYLATIKEQFDFAELHVRYRDVRPYSSECVSLVPAIDTATPVRWDVPVWARFGLPDPRLWLDMARSVDGRKGSWASFCDFYPTDWMLNMRSLHAFPTPSPLRIPAEREDKLRTEFLEQGADPENWFAVVHYRASSYMSKKSGQLRNGDPEAQLKMCNRIIDDLGGQVVLVGHPELEPFPSREGFVDLSRIPNSFMLQAFAHRHARFMMAGPSGPTVVSWGFHVPTASVDTTDAVSGWGSSENVILSHEVTTPDGRVLRNRDLHDAGLFEYRVLRDNIRDGEEYEVRKNSADELFAVARHMHSVTQDVPKWRAPIEVKSGPRPNQLVWPPAAKENLNFLDV